MQVAEPPNGSISVGWLCVSFLNMRSQGSVPVTSPAPSTMSTSIKIEQALISGDSSMSLRNPRFLSAFAPITAMSMRVTGLYDAPEVLGSARPA